MAGGVLDRGCSGIGAVHKSGVVTLRSRRRVGRVGVVSTPGRIAFAISKESAMSGGGVIGTFSVSKSQYRAVSVVRGELWAEKGKYCLKGDRVPAEAVVRRSADTAAPSILIASRTVGVISEEERPQGQVVVDHMIRYYAYDRLAFVIEAPETVIYPKGMR